MSLRGCIAQLTHRAEIIVGHTPLHRSVGDLYKSVSKQLCVYHLYRNAILPQTRIRSHFFWAFQKGVSNPLIKTALRSSSAKITLKDTFVFLPNKKSMCEIWGRGLREILKHDLLNLQSNKKKKFYAKSWDNSAPPPPPLGHHPCSPSWMDFYILYCNCLWRVLKCFLSNWKGDELWTNKQGIEFKSCICLKDSFFEIIKDKSHHQYFSPNLPVYIEETFSFIPKFIRNVCSQTLLIFLSHVVYTFYKKCLINTPSKYWL